MKKQADYIKRIEIRGLWGRKNISWELEPDVNILSGVNGGGKSTILNKSVNTLDMLEGGSLENDLSANVRFVFSPEDATFIHYDVIRSFDRPLLHGDLMEKMADKNVKSELDWQLYQLQRRYLDYQVNVGNRIIECLTSGHPEEATLISQPKTKFQDLVDELFGETGKTIIRKSNEILFEQDGDTLYPYQLSSGEKQMLVSSVTVSPKQRSSLSFPGRAGLTAATWVGEKTAVTYQPAISVLRPSLQQEMRRRPGTVGL